MPITMCRGCKSTPAALLDYITKKDEVTRIVYRDVDEGRPLASQYRENHEFHGKALGLDDRKYYHLIISWPAGCDITDDEMIDVNNKILDRYFPDHPAVTAVHNKEVLDGKPSNRHTHSCIDSVSLEKGRMVHMGQKEYAALKDYANELGAELGFEEVGFREPKNNKHPKAEMRAYEREGASWKDQLRDVIVAAYNDTWDGCGTFGDFMAKCEEQGVRLNEDGKWILQGHMPVGYSRLGVQYRPMEIFENLTERYLESVPEDLRQEANEIERRPSLMAQIMAADTKKKAKEAAKKEAAPQFTPEQMEYVREYRAAKDRFWKDRDRAMDMANKALQREYRSDRNREACRNYLRAQYLFKRSFGLLSFTLNVIGLGITRAEYKKEQARIQHIKDLRQELGTLCQEAVNVDVIHRDAVRRNALSDELEREIREQQAAIQRRIDKIVLEMEFDDLRNGGYIVDYNIPKKAGKKGGQGDGYDDR